MWLSQCGLRAVGFATAAGRRLAAAPPACRCVRSIADAAGNRNPNKPAAAEKKNFSRQYPLLSKQDLRPQIDPIESIQYLNSNAYRECYEDKPVWFYYRRNFIGQKAPKLTRRSCINTKGFLKTLSPCPICRDDYLVLDYRNVDLLKQFIDPITGQIIGTDKSGLCQQQMKNLIVAVIKARDWGLLDSIVPFREYDYTLYYAGWDPKLLLIDTKSIEIKQ